MKSMLDLAYQLEEVDYTKKNFVHADMSPDEFARVMEKRGESFLKMMWRAMGAAMAQQSAKGNNSDAELLFAFFAKNRSVRLKRVMSTQFSDLEASMKAIEGENGSTIIGQRNRKALDVCSVSSLPARNVLGSFMVPAICLIWKSAWLRDLGFIRISPA